LIRVDEVALMSKRDHGASDGILATARALVVDRAAAEIFTALSIANIDAVLLKGPVLARWLYADGAPRGYGDVDVLVAPGRRADAAAVLEGLGYRHGSRGFDEVDLHETISGVGVHPRVAWPLLWASTVSFEIGGAPARALGEPARALHVALHLAWHGPEPKPLADLERALRVAPEPVWRQAARLADQLAATDGLVTGLELLPAGRALREHLGLPIMRTSRARLGYEAAAPGSLRLADLEQGVGLRAKTRVLRRAFVPPSEEMRVRYPLARRGRRGLVAAHLLRLVRRSGELPATLVAWQRRRRDPSP
jgi:hypothetical protein